MVMIFLALAVVLLLCNAFFVLAEFAAVKARPTQIEALADRGNHAARKVQYIQTNLDKFLSVCQIGITLASIGLGFVGEPALAALIKHVVRFLGFGAVAELTVHTIAIAAAYLLVSFLHIVIGELVPKSIAIRKTESAALFTAYPLLFFHNLFILPLWLLNSSANAVLRLIGIPPVKGHVVHSEDEIRIILDQSQSSGIMSFRRLLFIENILDMGALTVRNAMRVRDKVRVLRLDASPAENTAVINQGKYSRYPVLENEATAPQGFVHVKDLYLATSAGKGTADLRPFVRPCMKVREDASLEGVLSEMQRKAIHLAVVYDEAGRWSGIVTLEDLLEEVVGTIEEEYPVEQSVKLSNFLSSADQVVLAVEGASIVEGTRNALRRVDPRVLPLSINEIMPHIIERERLGSSYVGKDLAIPHARLKNISRPIVVVARLKQPLAAPMSAGNETISYLFILLTPVNEPRLHQILLAHIAGIFESGFLETRLEDATSSKELYEAICAVEQATDMPV